MVESGWNTLLLASGSALIPGRVADSAGRYMQSETLYGSRFVMNILAMKKLIIVATALSVSVTMLISCASESTTTTAATTRQSNMAMQSQSRPIQPMGYRDNNMEDFYPSYWDALP